MDAEQASAKATNVGKICTNRATNDELVLKLHGPEYNVAPHHTAMTTQRLSLDARVLLRPARSFREQSVESPLSFRTALRRPLFVALTLGCVTSLAATGVLTLRIALPAFVYWGIVPVLELAALMMVVWPRRGRINLPRVVDTFFAGHGAWTLFLLLAALISFRPPELNWSLITGWALVMLVAVLAWSTYVDFCFFRHALGRSRAAAARDVVVARLITWTLVFGIFAVPNLSPRAAINEVAEVARELSRP